ncbi:MAG: transcription antitermination factor NusB [Myxococcota bacterium]
MSDEASAPRRSSRQAALQALYAVDVGPQSDLARAEDSLTLVSEHFELPAGALAFAEELVAGVVAEREELDRRIEIAARNWRIPRMAAVDRNVLRLAAWELGFGGTPAAVAIDEAVELARRFGDDGSPRFVNGVLGAMIEKEPE